MCVVPNMAVLCSSYISCFPDTLPRYFLNDFEMVPVAPIITGITFVFTFHMRCISVVRSLHFRIFSSSFFITFLSPKLQRLLGYMFLFHYQGLYIFFCFLLGVVLLVRNFRFHNIIALPSRLVSADFIIVVVVATLRLNCENRNAMEIIIIIIIHLLG
jgi:hypothetical protein